jgi:hypothetical protein
MPARSSADRQGHVDINSACDPSIARSEAAARGARGLTAGHHSFLSVLARMWHGHATDAGTAPRCWLLRPEAKSLYGLPGAVSLAVTWEIVSGSLRPLTLQLTSVVSMALAS